MHAHVVGRVKDPTVELLERIYAEQMRQADVMDTLGRRQRRVERALADAGLIAAKPKARAEEGEHARPAEEGDQGGPRAFGRLARLGSGEAVGADGNDLASVSEMSEDMEERESSLVRADSRTEVSSTAESPLPSGRTSPAEAGSQVKV